MMRITTTHYDGFTTSFEMERDDTVSIQDIIHTVKQRHKSMVLEIKIVLELI